jgi:RHS repeat-associated protein
MRRLESGHNHAAACKMLCPYKTNGQRLESGIGLYYYRARWYDPTAGRFIQADTLITNIEKSQSFDRYAYVGNNPIRYVDPSGHRSDCTEQEIASGDETCEENFTIEDRENLLKDLYGWNILGDWTTEELIVLAEVAETIIKYVNQITNGNGTSWFLDYMGDININRLGGTNHYVLGNTVYITFTFLQTTTYHEDFAHELAHVWDNRTASMIGSFGATWYGGGAADELTKYVGGDPRGLRWWNGTSGIPPDYQWKKAIKNGYGNHSTADYFAESFGWMIYNESALPQRTILIKMKNMITLQANGGQP